MSMDLILGTLLYWYEEDPARTERDQVDKTGLPSESRRVKASYIGHRGHPGANRAVRTTQTGVNTRENSAEKRTRALRVSGNLT